MYEVTSKVVSIAASIVETMPDVLLPRKLPIYQICNTTAEEKPNILTVIVKNTKFTAHKSILAASGAMNKLFAAKHDGMEVTECKIHDVEPKIFEAFLSYIYGNFESEHLCDIAHDLYAAAHNYEVEMLKKICLDEIHKKLSTTNVLKSYTMAFQYDLEELKAEAWQIITR